MRAAPELGREARAEAWGVVSRGVRMRTVALGVIALACVAVGLGVWRATSSEGESDRLADGNGTASAAGCSSARATARSRAALLAAERRFLLEADGPTTHRDLREVASDPMLLQALAANDLAGALQAANHQLVRHVVRIRVLRGSHVLVDANPTSFDVAGVEMPLGGGGALRGERVKVTLQDVIGFNKLVHRLIHAEAVVRGSGGQMRTTLPAAARVRLPSRGCVRLGARGYAVASFAQRSFTDEHLSIWILTPA